MVPTKVGTTFCLSLQRSLSWLDYSSKAACSWILQVDSAKQLTNKLQEAGKQLVPVMEGNLVDKIWGDARPAAPSGPIRIHNIEHAGRNVQDKLSDMRKAMQGQTLIRQWCKKMTFA